MNERSLWEWTYTTLIVGHEGPVLAIMLIVMAVALLGAFKGWIRIGPPGEEEKKGKPSNGNGKMSEETRRHLYQGDGTTKYMPRKECFDSRQECDMEVCNKIDEVKVLVTSANLKVDAASKERSEELQRISEFIGKTTEFMEHVNNDIRDIRGALMILAKGS